MKTNDREKMGEAGLSAPFGEIPRKLKEYYDSLQDEAIPDKFLELLERLDEAERMASQKFFLSETTIGAEES